MKRKLWVGLIVVGLVAFVALALLSQKIPQILENRIRSELAQVGAEQVSLGQPYWGLTGAGTKGLSLSGQFEQWQYRIEVESLQTAYHWRTLIDGEIKNVTIDGLHVDLKQLGQSDTAQEPLALSQLLNTLNKLHLPVNTINLKQLDAGLTLSQTKPLHISASNLIFEQAKGLFRGNALVSVQGDNVDQLPTLAIEVTGEPFLSGSGNRNGNDNYWHQNQNDLSDAIHWLSSLKVSIFDGQTEFLASTLALKKRPIPTGEEVSLSESNGPQLWFAGQFHHADITNLLSSFRFASPFTVAAEPLKPEHSGEPMMPRISGKIGLSGMLALPEILDLTTPDWQQTSIDAQANVSFELAMPQLGQLGQVEMHSAEITTAVRLASDNQGQISINLSEPLRASGQLRAANWPSLQTAMKWPDLVSFSGNANSSNPIEISLLSSPTEPQWLKIPEMVISLTAGEGAGQLTTTSKLTNLSYGEKLNGEFNSNAELAYQENRLPTVNVKGTFSQFHKDIFLSGTFQVVDWHAQGNIKLKGTPNNTTIDGKVELDNVSALSAEAVRLGLYDGDIALASGRLTAEFSVLPLPPSKPIPTKKAAKPEDPNFGLKLNVNASDLSGIAEGVAFNGVALSGAVTKLSGWTSSKPITMKAAQISTGVVIKNLIAEAQLKQSKDFSDSHWQLDNFNAELFSGQVKLSKPALIDFPFKGNALTIQLSNLSLSEILALYEDQAVQGTGTLNGEIPLILESEGVRVANGALHNIEVGNIKVASAKTAALSASNKQLATTMRLLENFNYETLEITANFEPSGKLLLGVQLLGRNPAEFNGRQINFNINLEDNVYDLLKALSLTDEMTKKLEKRLQK